MPKAMEEALEREAAKKGISGERKDAFVYGTMRKTGWKPAGERAAARTAATVEALRKRGK
jgi:hypothetical protein